MRRLALVSVLVAVTLTATAQVLTPNAISAAISAEGSTTVVRRLWADGSYEHVLDRVASGDSAWISLAPKLAAGADAAASEGLGVALARALPRNANAVLSVLNAERPAISPDRVCGLPFVEGSIDDISAYRRDATAAVTSVNDGALRQRRAECLAALQQH